MISTLVVWLVTNELKGVNQKTLIQSKSTPYIRSFLEWLFYLEYLHNSISHSIFISNRTTAELKSQVQQSGKFESLSQGGTRPTQIIEKYELLYTQGRLDAMDDLDQIAGLSKYGKHQEMKQKILYGIMVVCSVLCYLLCSLLLSTITTSIC